MSADPGFSASTLPQNPGTMTSETRQSISSSSQCKNKGRQNPSPGQGRETFIPAQGLHIQGTDRRSDRPGWMSAGGSRRHSVLVASFQAGLGRSFSSGAEQLPFAFKGWIQLARTRTPGERGKGHLESDTGVRILLYF